MAQVCARDLNEGVTHAYFLLNHALLLVLPAMHGPTSSYMACCMRSSTPACTDQHVACAHPPLHVLINALHAPRTTTGKGDPQFTIPDETFAVKHDERGLLAMANNGQPHTGSCQWYVTLAPLSWLDGKRVVFGKVLTQVR